MSTENDFFLSTSQAAELLEVHESSVKRWCNEGHIQPSKTQGGHRRIAFKSLLIFAKIKLPACTLLRLEPFASETAQAALQGREFNNFQPLVNLIINMCGIAYPGHLTYLFRYLKSVCNIPMVRVFDLGLGEALRRIGNEWSLGTRSIGHGHRFTQKILDALHGLRSEDTDLRDAEAPLAIVGCAESSFHEIGAMLARLTLEEAGWQVCYLGGNVPFSEYAEIQNELQASLVAISFVPPCGNQDARRCLTTLAASYGSNHPYKLVFGGSGINNKNMGINWPFLELKIVSETESLLVWAKNKNYLSESVSRRIGYANK